MQCHICKNNTRIFDKAQILGKYTVCYFKCDACGFIQTETPYWLDESYSKAISDIDLGVVNRGITCSRFTQFLLLTSFEPNKSFVDYGGGYGMFTRLMRDLGYDFYRYDTYCENTLALGFEADTPNKQYELLTAFEVFEHLVDPLAEIEKMLTYSDNILFTTELIPAHQPKPGAWWYYALPTGQHVSFYSYGALAHIAQHFGLYFASNGSSLHLLSKKRVSPYIFRVLARRKLRDIVIWLLRRRLSTQSLLATDFARASGFILR